MAQPGQLPTQSAACRKELTVSYLVKIIIGALRHRPARHIDAAYAQAFIRKATR